MKHPQPISVVIPLYNRAHLIGRTLDSVYNQSYRPIRLIVVDNDSSDGSADAVKRWAEEHSVCINTTPGGATGVDFTLTLLHEPRRGASIARNTGLKACDTEWLLFFDSDDCMTPRLIERIMAETERDPDLDIVFWRMGVMNPDGAISPRRFSLHHILRRHLFNAQFATLGYAVRAGFIRRAGGWDETLTCWDDWELGTRLLEHNPKMKGISEILVHIYPQDESITGLDHQSKAGRWEQAIRAIEAHEIADPKLSTRVKEAMIYRRFNLAALYASEGRSDLARDLIAETQRLPLWKRLPAWRRKLLKGIFHYTRLGGRGAYIVWR